MTDSGGAHTIILIWFSKMFPLSDVNQIHFREGVKLFPFQKELFNLAVSQGAKLICYQAPHQSAASLMH